MDRKVKGFAFAVGAVALGVVAMPGHADAQLVLQRAPLMIGTTIALECSNSGGHQDVSKTPILKNTSGATLRKGQTLRWKSTDGDQGSIKLEADLAVGATISGLGQPGNAYQCSASFVTAPDLTIKSAGINAQGQAMVTIANLDSWVDSAPQVVRFEVMSCSGNTVLAAVDSSAFSVTKGTTQAFTLPLPSVSGGKRYVRAKADATGKVPELNETNNLYAAMDTCVY